MKYYSIGYAVNDGLPEVTREDVQKLTHMNLAFGLISENGLLVGPKIHMIERCPTCAV